MNIDIGLDKLSIEELKKLEERIEEEIKHRQDTQKNKSQQEATDATQQQNPPMYWF